MASKRQSSGGVKSKKKTTTSNENWTTEETLVAVVIADSFNYRFLPITQEKPRTLLPLVNRPLLDYTIDFLTHAGVQMIHVYCCSHADQVREYLQEKEADLKNCCEISSTCSERAYSLGDALREIDNKDLIKSDFILVCGDLVSNMKLQKALEEHKQRRKTDKMSVMTMILKESAPGHRSRCEEEDMIAAIDPKNNRLLHHQITRQQTKISFPVSMFLENPRVHLHYNLLDCHVCICSPQVTQLFVDNFDYQTIEDFIRGILISEEIMGYHIHTYTITNEYALRVSNLQMYNAVSKDVIHRWSYPLVPDQVHNSGGESYIMSRQNIYIGTVEVSLTRSCTLHEDVVIGSHCCVGEGTEITRSVIGNGCKIGDNVVIEDSYIWNNVEIGSGCRITNSILCDGCRIHQNVVIKTGCILSFDVAVGPDVTVHENCRITTKRAQHVSASELDGVTRTAKEQNGSTAADQSEQSSTSELDGVDITLEEQNDSTAESQCDYEKDILGSEGRGYVWPPKLFDPDFKDIHEDDEKDVFDSSTDSDDSSSGEIFDTELGEEVDQFHIEVCESVRQGYADKTCVENIILEINASKFAYNRTMVDLVRSVILAVMEGPPGDSHKVNAESYLSYYKEAFKYFKTLIASYSKDRASQVICLEAVEDFCLENSTVLPLIQRVIVILYDLEIIEESAIRNWYADLPAESDEAIADRKCLKEKLQRFMRWLDEAEEESSTEEDDSEDEDDDDDDDAA